MTQIIPHNDARLRWEGAASVVRTAEWSQPCRVPYEDRDLYADALVLRALAPSGVRLALMSDTNSLAGSIVPVEEMANIDLYVNGQLCESAAASNKSEFHFATLPTGMKRIELWLPQTGEFRLRALMIDGGAKVEPFEDKRPRWVTYGSSITHCGHAQSPSFTWPAIVARECDLHLTSLGFSGQCHADPLIGRLMRDLPADYLSIWVGINIYGGGTMSLRTFRQAVIGLVKTVRDGHPDEPLVVLSPIFGVQRETTPNRVDFTLPIMREEVAAAVIALQAHGDRNLHYVNGLDIFGPDLAHLLPDNLHPNAEGYKVMGKNFAEKVARRYFRKSTE